MSFQHLFKLANESGGTLYLMVFLLLLALTVIIERWRYLANMYKVGEKAIALCRSKKIINKNTLQEFHQNHAEVPLLHLLEVAIDGEHDHLSQEELSGSLEEALMHEVPKLDRSLWLLDTVITLALLPMQRDHLSQPVRQVWGAYGCCLHLHQMRQGGPAAKVSRL